MAGLPSGTVTFLFTDIEGSTRLWAQDHDAMAVALARHDAVLTAAITAQGGYVFKTVGDAICAAFPSAPGPRYSGRPPLTTQFQPLLQCADAA
jgi:class 3 adenylate cyclase